MKKKENKVLIFARQRGKCPDRYYYTNNGKSAQENCIEQKNRLREQVQEDASDRKQDTEIRKQIDQEVRKQADIAVEKILKQIMR